MSPNEIYLPVRRFHSRRRQLFCENSAEGTGPASRRRNSRLLPVLLSKECGPRRRRRNPTTPRTRSPSDSQKSKGLERIRVCRSTLSARWTEVRTQGTSAPESHYNSFHHSGRARPHRQVSAGDPTLRGETNELAESGCFPHGRDNGARWRVVVRDARRETCRRHSGI